MTGEAKRLVDGQEGAGLSGRPAQKHLKEGAEAFRVPVPSSSVPLPPHPILFWQSGLYLSSQVSGCTVGNSSLSQLRVVVVVVVWGIGMGPIGQRTAGGTCMSWLVWNP